MFTLFFVIAFFALSGLCLWRYRYLQKKDKNTGWNDGAQAAAWAGGIVLVVSFIATFCFYSGQVSDIENIQKYEQLEMIYDQKAKSLTAEFAKYLAETYPNFEKDIFKQISPEKVSLYVVKYPDLQSSKTLMTLVEQINQLQSDKYQQQINKAVVLKDMRFAVKNPWIYNSLIPRIPEKYR